MTNFVSSCKTPESLRKNFEDIFFPGEHLNFPENLRILGAKTFFFEKRIFGAKTFVFRDLLRVVSFVLGLERVCPRKGCPWPRIFVCPWP